MPQESSNDVSFFLLAFGFSSLSNKIAYPLVHHQRIEEYPFLKRIPAAPGRAVGFARSPPAGAFAGFVLSLSLISRPPPFFPPVEQHSQHAAAGGQHQADPQRHIAAVPGLGAFCLLRRLALCVRAWLDRLAQSGRMGLGRGESGRVSRIRWLSGFNRLQRGTNLHIFFVLILCAGRIA